MKKIAIILAAFMFVGIIGCEKDFLDINVDPNVPTTAEPSKLLTGAQVSMAYVFTQRNYVGNGLLSFVHQLVSREVPQYNMQASGTLGNTWSSAYTSILPNLDAIISEQTANGNLRYVGISKLMKAYTFSVMVDLFGDIPYSESNIPGLIAPKLDDDVEVYNTLIALIDEAIEDLNNTEASNLISPSTDDLIYGGNIDKWLRLANTLKLKLFLNTRNVQSEITDYADALDALIAEDNFMLEDEDFEFWFTNQMTPDQRHPAFVDEYDGGQITYYISPWFYEIMNGLTINATENPFAGVYDPRVPYYWANQLTASDDAQNPHEYRHDNFVSIVFGSIGPNADGAQRESATMIGLYPCGGKYDDGTGSGGEGFKGSDGDGVAPQKFITYASSRFMLAELAITGVITGDAEEYFEEGVRAAFAHVNKVVSNSTMEGIPAIAPADIDNYVTSVLSLYGTTDDEGKLEMIMTQKWISNFFNPVESYTDYRRTGYPVLFDPLPGEVIIPVDYEGNFNTTSPVQLIRKYPKSLWYPSSEVELNPNVTQKTNLSESRVFWDTRTYDY